MKKTKPLYKLYVGIDIAKGKADACILQVFPDRSRKDKTLRKRVRVDFSKSGVEIFHETVLKYADEQCSAIVYAMEDTGIYYRGFYSYLQQMLDSRESLEVLKPSYVAHWCKLHERSKSDPLDAHSIAQIIAYERDYKTITPAFSNEKREYSELRTGTRRHAQLKKISSQESARLIGLTDIHAPELSAVFGTGMTFLKVLAVFPSTYDIIHADKAELVELVKTASKNHFGEDKVDWLLEKCEDSLARQEPTDTDRETIRSLVRHILSLQSEMAELSSKNSQIAASLPGYNSLLSIPGCGKNTAAVILAEIMDIKRFKSADALVHYAGTNPVNDRSGSSVHSQKGISHNGSKYLRHAIVMIAEFARRHNPVLKDLFNRLKAGQRKRHFLALIAVANRLLHYIYSVLKNDKVFVINFKDLLKLKEETRMSFFQNITTQISAKERKNIYHYEDESGEIHPFIYTVRYRSASSAEPV